VAIGVDALFLNRLETMAGGLQIAGLGKPATQPSARPAARAQVDALIADLLNDAPYRDNRNLTLLSEGVFRIDMILWSTRRSIALRPMYLLDAVRAYRETEKLAPAFDALDTTKPTPLPRVERRGFPTAASAMFSRTMGTPYRRVVQVNAQLLFERRAAAIALATRLYYLEHGNYPPSLAQLVPYCLPSVPVDPFDPNAGPIRYLLLDQNGPRPIAYSLAENGVDDTINNVPGTVPPVTQWGWQAQPRTLDQHRDLSQWMPAAPPLGYDRPMGNSEPLPEAGGDQ
jgi:hypothetical protein